jgi:hypothetical protein
MKQFRRSLAAAALIASAALSSCVGISADVRIGADGSGSVSLEYRVSRLVESMGKLEGGERWLPLPFDRPSFERAVRELGGLSLRDFSSRADETDRTVSATVAFADPPALARFLAASGRPASFAAGGGARTVSLTLSEGGGPLDPDLRRLTDALFAGYAVDLRFFLPAAPSATGGGTVDGAARSVSFSAPVTGILAAEKPLAWSVSW